MEQGRFISRHAVRGVLGYRLELDILGFFHEATKQVKKVRCPSRRSGPGCYTTGNPVTSGRTGLRMAGTASREHGQPIIHVPS